jgi:hypothetical protein
VSRHLAALALPFMLVACPPGPGPASVPGVTAAQSRPFAFHSGPWVNLHLLLYGLALKQTGHLKGGGGGNGLVVLDGVDASLLSAAELPAWQAAVDLYARLYADRDPTFDDELATINNDLAAAETASDLSASGVPVALAHALEQAMPVYRAHWWKDDDRRNRAWIASAQAELDRDGSALPSELAGFFQTTWPTTPIRVDVTRFATWGGAYTTLAPDHITLSGADARNTLPAGFESLLHEASHTLVRPVRNALDRELAAQQKSAKGLWHALLFFTAGYVVKERTTGYVPYAYAYNLYDGRWQPYRRALETYWTPYLEGHTTFDAAIRDVVTAL